MAVPYSNHQIFFLVVLLRLMRIRLLPLYIVLVDQVWAEPAEFGGVHRTLGVLATEVDILIGGYHSVSEHMSLPGCLLDFGSYLQAITGLWTCPVTG